MFPDDCNEYTEALTYDLAIASLEDMSLFICLAELSYIGGMMIEEGNRACQD
jgi:hypothetical protein